MRLLVTGLTLMMISNFGCNFPENSAKLDQESESLSAEGGVETVAHDREFDFWVGDWTVQNKHLQSNGSWQPGGVAKAKIRSVLGGQAILEQWTGQGQLALRGFSLRTYDPEQKRWEIILNWHSGSPSTFSYMIGNFVDDRGEFFPPTPQPRTRFTFSKAKAESCQWDQATSMDGKNWTTDWIMEFSRTGPSVSVDAETLPIEQPHESVDRKFPETRQLDGLIGEWEGIAKRLNSNGEWEEGTAIRRVTSMIDGYALLQMTKYSWGEESIAAFSYNLQQQKWIEIGTGTEEADCHWLAGKLEDNSMRLNELPTSDNHVNHVWSKLKKVSFVWERELVDPESGEATTNLHVEFKLRENQQQDQ